MDSKTPKKQKSPKSPVVKKTAEQDLWVISEYLKELKFTPRVLGVDEADVWKKIEKLCELYENELATERAKNKKLVLQLNACAAQMKKFLSEKKKEEEPNG